ncbi:uncharacterized protein L969DRAFT_92171 [Mixia osmundae IAM 14324]|uniref:Glucosamine 6-phosphate N-acetyltransferase n=1 Tax=Mixia osmundae (strain CBS 9802 / IAM 14324 / JCM 22182 / KY 12970) TaxID=764103 RepID=G7DT44_MIXOS|nr:uncharacterized protein L969DRAFT_92171 [Mixia osmundae IAM 14324]KEI42744.1 hypothetical protein L969DRAFT_92171 [Mixia osmundae IAM 14324]GAA93923.1 hypothetical protein E5Q_00569 [Mixia osmundae IAM 14324]
MQSRQDEMAFDAHDWLDSIQSDLKQGYIIRPLARDDYSKGHLDVLTVLTQAPDPGQAAWQSRFDEMHTAQPAAYYPLVVATEHKIMAVGTLIVERKFLRGLGLVGHIEDIAVSKEAQGQSLGKKIILALTAIGEKVGCYKVILDCNKDNIPFYEKCGYVHKEYEMVRYTPEEVLKAARSASS